MNQKTKKGQPVMKNYVKYALAKLEENIAQDQLKSKQNKQQLINNSWCFATPLQSSFILVLLSIQIHLFFDPLENREFNW